MAGPLCQAQVFADYFSLPASVKVTLSQTKSRGKHEIQRRRNGTTKKV
jgi:hypothetical protein